MLALAARLWGHGYSAPGEQVEEVEDTGLATRLERVRRVLQKLSL
jgi:hypothetical protein